MNKIICTRCGQENEVDNFVILLRKCPKCEGIKFEREFFFPIEMQVIKNFKKTVTSHFGSILDEIYLFGSYVSKVPKCGDIDFLITYDEEKLKKIINLEIEKFQNQFDFVLSGNYSLSEIKAILNDGLWDFRICEDYPDCLNCYRDNGGTNCRLPSKNFHSDLHIYCLEKCRCKTKNPIPECCFEHCVFLNSEIQNQIEKEIMKNLKENIMEFYEINPELKIKVLDFIMKKNVNELINEFKINKENKELELYKINPIKGSKIKLEI